MDTTLRSAHSSRPPTQPSTFSSSTLTLNPSTNLTSVSGQPPQLCIPPNPVNPAFTASFQSAPASSTQVAMPQTQTFSHSLSNPSHSAGLPVAPQGINQSVPRSEGFPTSQPAGDYPHQVSGLGGPTATAPFLQDFNLVAEAAKRAQMSIVMRDLESVTL
ncbi:hypothetical protein N7462_002144 [Penicillium macrosclerotiorum]|uniref:uncharacterized protein n=1 Tax=Penicillium macrosclerotiorum TaxID=303699 RepID=UPI002546672F|nr:uncharacterized protein N7462_002144 [Penicillium macrosclerotiorum]KAJ5692721.1 hypothetical protein N7462_002144 [Penicillium macrosclerotiorum]